MNFIKAIVAAGLVAASTSAFAADITGAGSTFIFPVLSKWADAYKKESGSGVNYQSIGSGAGIKQIQANTVTFGATDAPLKAEQLEKDGFAQWPMIMGAIVPVVNTQALVITDNVSVIRQLLLLKELVDVPPARVISEFVTLQRADVVAITQLGKEVHDDRPIPVPASGAELAFDIGLQILLQIVVVEERIVDIHQEDDGGTARHAASRAGWECAGWRSADAVLRAFCAEIMRIWREPLVVPGGV